MNDYRTTSARQRAAARRKHSRKNPPSVTPGPGRVATSFVASGRIASLIILLIALLSLAYLFSAPRFAIQDITIQGAQALNETQVIDLAQARGRSIWFVDTRAIVERLKTSAYVEQASAVVSLPNHLTITLVERRPETRWQIGVTRYLIDGSGRVLGTDSTAPLTGTLIIEDQSTRALQPNDQVDSDALTLARLLALRLPAELHVQPGRISWDQNQGITVNLPDQHRVVFGRSDHLDDKLAVLNVLLHDGTAFTYLDLRSNTPYYRNDGTTTPTPQPQGAGG